MQRPGNLRSRLNRGPPPAFEVMEDPMNKNLEERVARLEMGRRRWHGACVVLLVASVVAAMAPRTHARYDGKDATPGALRVSQLELVDAEGQVRARLGLDDDGDVKLLLFGGAGQGRRVELTAGPSSSPALVLRNDAGRGQWIASLPETGPALIFRDQAGQLLTSLTSKNSDGTSLLGMKLPGERKLRAVMTVMADGRPYFKLRGPEGELRLFAKPEIEYIPAAGK